MYSAPRQGGGVVDRMRHEIRQGEARREDIRALFFAGVLDYAEIDLSVQAHPCELTGALVIDRARGLGFCGLSERCDEEGARLMHEASGLRATLLFELAPGEYHTTSVGRARRARAAIVCPQGIADPQWSTLLFSLYAPHVVRCAPAEHAPVGNAIALSPGSGMDERARQSCLGAGTPRPATWRRLRGRDGRTDAIEAGAVARCCVGEIFDACLVAAVLATALEPHHAAH
jgi:hypothetical protein